MFPVEPLLTIASQRLRSEPVDRSGQLVTDSAQRIAELLGTHRQTIHRWRTAPTRLTVYDADLYANRLKLHPSQVWGPMWYDHEIEWARKHYARAMEGVSA